MFHWIFLYSFIFGSFYCYANENTILSITPEKIDFGVFPAKDKQEGTAKISNNGNVPVKIVSIRNTCSCAEVKIDKMVISPQDTADLKITLLPEGIYGEFSKNIYIETDSKAERFVTVTISGNSQALVKVTPENNVNLGILKKNVKLQQELELESTDVNIEFGTPVVKSEIPISVKLTAQKPSCFALKYELDTNSKNQKFLSEITVPIIKPDGWKPVSITIAGRVGHQLIIIPSKITLPANTNGNVEKTFQFRLSGDKTLDSKLITFTAIKGMNIKFENEKENSISARITFNPGFMESLKQNSMQIKFQYPDTDGADFKVSAE